MRNFTIFARRDRELQPLIAPFRPLEDITAYELAFCVAHFGGGLPPKEGISFEPKVWDELPDNIKRHFG